MKICLLRIEGEKIKFWIKHVMEDSHAKNIKGMVLDVIQSMYSNFFILQFVFIFRASLFCRFEFRDLFCFRNRFSQELAINSNKFGQHIKLLGVSRSHKSPKKKISCKNLSLVNANNNMQSRCWTKIYAALWENWLTFFGAST